MIFGNGEILKEQINTIKPFYIFDIKDRKDEIEREKSIYPHLNQDKHHYYVEGNKYSTYIEPATKFWNLDELYNCINKLFKLNDIGFGKWFDYENEFIREYSLDHTFDSEYDLGVYCVIRTSETDYQLILIDKFIINFACNEDVLNNVLDFYNWTEYFGKEWEEMRKKRSSIE